MPIGFTTEHELALESFSSSSFLQVNKILMKMYGIEMAVFIGNLVDKLKYFRSRNMLTEDGGFFLTHADQTEQIGLSDYQLRKHKQTCRELGILATKMVGIPPKEFYFLDLEVLVQIFKEYSLKNLGNDRLKTKGIYKETKLKETKPLKTICSGKNPERLDHSENDSVWVIPRKRKPPTQPTKTITMEVPDLEEKNEQYLPYVQRLAQIACSAPGVMHSKQKVQLDAARTKQWVNEIRLLCDKDGVTTNELTRVLDWYAEHIGGEFIPEVQSAGALRRKWPNLLAAIERGKSKPWKKPGGVKQLLGGAAAIPGKYDDVKTIVIDNTKF